MRWRPVAVALFAALAGPVAYGGGAPDLIMTDVAGPGSAIAGQTIIVNNTARNDGSVGAVAFSIGIYLSSNTVIDPLADTLLGERLVSALDESVEDTDSTQVTIPTDVVTGDYYIGAYADHANDVFEIREDNNDLADPGGVRIQGPDSASRGWFGGGCAASPRGAGQRSRPGAPGALLQLFVMIAPLALVHRRRRRARPGRAR